MWWEQLEGDTAALFIKVRMKDGNSCWHLEKCLLWDARNGTLWCTWLLTGTVSSSLPGKKAGDGWAGVSQEQREGSRLSPCQAVERMSCKVSLNTERYGKYRGMSPPFYCTQVSKRCCSFFSFHGTLQGQRALRGWGLAFRTESLFKGKG